MDEFWNSISAADFARQLAFLADNDGIYRDPKEREWMRFAAAKILKELEASHGREAVSRD